MQKIKELIEREQQARRELGISRSNLLTQLKSEGWVHFEGWESSPVWVHPHWAQAYKEEGDEYENIPDECIWMQW